MKRPKRIQAIPSTPFLDDARSRGHVEFKSKLYRMKGCLILVGQSGAAGTHLFITHPRRPPNQVECQTALAALIPPGIIMAEVWTHRQKQITEKGRHFWQVLEKSMSGESVAQARGQHRPLEDGLFGKVKEVEVVHFVPTDGSFTACSRKPKSHWRVTSNDSKVTCQLCLRQVGKREQRRLENEDFKDVEQC